MTTKIKRPRRRRTLAMFIKALGACNVPQYARGNPKPEAAWESAWWGDRRWMIFRVKRHCLGVYCYGSEIDPSPANKLLVLSAFARFKRTGRIAGMK